MISYALVALAVVSSAFAAPTPTGPGGGTKVSALGQCDISWTADTDKTAPWTTMNIELMTGSNQQMTHMRTVATVDATTTTSFSWVCPDVDIYAPIYFYQFSSPAAPTALQWVTRFTITGTDGSSVPAPETDATNVGWGVGHFKDAALYNALPAYLNGNGQLQGAPGNGTTTSGTSSSGAGASTTPTGTGTGTSTGSVAATSTGSGTLATITKPSSTGSGSASPSSTATSSIGGAVALSSSSLMALFGAVMAGAAALSL